MKGFAAFFALTLVISGCNFSFLTTEPPPVGPSDTDVLIRTDSLNDDGQVIRSDWRWRDAGILEYYETYEYPSTTTPSTQPYRTDRFSGADARQWTETRLYDSLGRVTQWQHFDPNLTRTEAEAYKYRDSTEDYTLQARYNAAGALVDYLVFFYENGVRVGEATYGPGETVLGLTSLTLDAAGRTTQILNFEGSTLTGAEVFVFREASGDALTSHHVYGQGGELTQYTRWTAYDIPLEGIPDTVVQDDYTRGLGNSRALEDLTTVLTVPDLPSAPPAVPSYTLGDETGQILRAKTVWVYDPYGSTRVELTPVSIGVRLPDVSWNNTNYALPPYEIPFLPVSILRTDNRLPQTVEVQLTYDADYRIVRKKTFYGAVDALTVELAYGAPGGTGADANDDYLLTQVTTTGAVMQMPLTYQVSYTEKRLPFSLGIYSSGTHLQTLEFDYAAIAAETLAAVDGFDPVSAGQDPLAYGSKLLKLFTAGGWKVKQYGFGAAKPLLAQYSFGVQAGEKPGMKIDVEFWENEVFTPQGYYFLGLDVADRAAYFEVWKPGATEPESRYTYGYGDIDWGTWADKAHALYGYVETYKDDAIDLAQDLAENLDVTLLSGLLGADQISVLTQFFR